MFQVACDFIISDTTQIRMRMKIDKYNSTVKFRRNGVTETLNLECEPEFGDDTEDDFTSETDTEEDIVEDFEDGEFYGFKLTIEEDRAELAATSEEELKLEKVQHPEEEHARGILALFNEYSYVIANSFYEAQV